jgi:AbiV family abortive infection protein
MKKLREYNVHDEFLTEYGNAAIENAQQILDDAKILLGHKSFARAYFLAVAAIEETGKAYMAFSSKGRNLSDEGLKKKVQKIFESHSQKISCAFTGWIAKASNPRESIEAALELIHNLKLGREKSMYVDVNPDNSLNIPMIVARPVAATDSVRVAENCIFHTKHYMSENHPPSFSSFDDKFFCLKTEKITEIFNTEDFGEYLLSELNKVDKNFNFSKAIVTYHDKFFCRNKSFKTKKS